MADAALVLDIISGTDTKDDATSTAQGVQSLPFTSYATSTEEALSGYSIGVARELYRDENVPDFVLKAFESALITLKKLRAQVTDVKLPGYDKEKFEETEKNFLHLEFEPFLESYLAQLDHPGKCRTLDEIMEFTKSTEAEDFPHRDVDRMGGSIAMNAAHDLDSDVRKLEIAKSRRNGITAIDSAIDSLLLNDNDNSSGSKNGAVFKWRGSSCRASDSDYSARVFSC